MRINTCESENVNYLTHRDIMIALGMKTIESNAGMLHWPLNATAQSIYNKIMRSRLQRAYLITIKESCIEGVVRY